MKRERERERERDEMRNAFPGARRRTPFVVCAAVSACRFCSVKTRKFVVLFVGPSYEGKDVSYEVNG